VTEPPGISVVLPFRDVEGTLPAAVESILRQRGVSVELLAVDDASRDGGPAWVAAKARRDPRVRLLRADRSGLVPALERGWRAATHPLIARMDGDDVALPDRLHRQAEALTPGVGALGTRVEAWGGGEGLRRYVAWQNGLVDAEAHRTQRFVEAPLCHPSVLLRREALEAVGGYRDASWPEDYDLWLRLVEAGWALAKVPEILLRWRHREDRATFSHPRYGPARLRALRAAFLAPELARVLGRRRLAVWGAGKTGRRLMAALEGHGPRVDRWIDIDPAKVGRTARGAPILDRASLSRGEDFVLVAVGARGARDEVRRWLLGRGWAEGGDFLAAS
jgi:glycosyltransferase involved in cell wall biosynthesis